MSQHVLSCIDGSAITGSVCDASVWAANRLALPILLLHTIEKALTPAREDFSGSIGLGSREQLLDELTELDEKRNKLALEHGRQLLDDARQYMAKKSDQTCEIKQRHGDLAEAILEHEELTRLLVMGRSGNEHNQPGALGNHVEVVARSVHRPILITVGKFDAPTQFMVAYDGSATSDVAIERITASPLLKGLKCHMVSVNETNAITTSLDLASQKLHDKGFDVTQHHLQGSVSEQLLQFQKEQQIELMIMGAYGHSRVRQFFVGSNTAKMITHSDASLLLLR